MALDLQSAASPNEVEETLPDKAAEEMAKEGFYLVKSVLAARQAAASRDLGRTRRPPAEGVSRWCGGLGCRFFF